MRSVPGEPRFEEGEKAKAQPGGINPRDGKKEEEKEEENVNATHDTEASFLSFFWDR